MNSRARRGRTLALAVPAAALLAAGVVVVARALLGVSGVQDFLLAYPGLAPLPPGAPVGIPAAIGVLHFLNTLFLLLIVRSGWAVRRGQRPPAYWTPRDLGPAKVSRPAPRLSLTVWLHMSLDALWVLTGVAYVVLLIVTGHWVRIIPTSLDVVPNAVSAGLQYASFSWPVEGGWSNYNALQQLTYFVTVFVAAPLAIATGVRMSPYWPESPRTARLYPIAVARRLHFPVMLWFVGFTAVHVFLVAATGVQRNLNHMYAASPDAASWLGPALFGGSVAVMVAAWMLVRPLLLRPLASLTGTVSRS